MAKFRPVLILLTLLALAWLLRDAPAPADQRSPEVAERPQYDLPRSPPAAQALPDFLPPEAAQTLALIARGGPYPHRQDGSVFGNRERLLPPRPRGYYREYTVDTPGLGHRGARRIVTGGDPPTEYWYTDDHYASFQPFRRPR
jgi:guanyl-specific ribonuclease Sa